MNTLPKDIEDIVNDYKHQMNTIERFQSTLDVINKLHYNVNKYSEFIVSSRLYTNKYEGFTKCSGDTIQYYVTYSGKILYTTLNNNL